MTEPISPAPGLDILRRELDEIDDSLLALLLRRFAVTSKVKAFKPEVGAQSPLRPAREAQILRRLLDKAGPAPVPPELVVRLWRTILSQSSLLQAPITVHVGQKLGQSMSQRLMLRDHFGRTPVEVWRDDVQAMTQVNVSPGDICIVEPNSLWVEPFLEGKAGTAQVIGTLPTLQNQPVPELLVIGNAPTSTSGSDETLLISNGNLPRDFAVEPLWQAKSGPFRVTALAGFFSDHDSLLLGLSRSNVQLGLKVAGRYPSPIEV